MSEAEDKCAGIVDEDPTRAALIAKTRMTLADNEEYLSLFSDKERVDVELALAGKKPLDTIPLPVVNFEEEVETVASALCKIAGLLYQRTLWRNMLNACVAFTCTYSGRVVLERYGRCEKTRFDDLMSLMGDISNGTSETRMLDSLALEVSTGLKIVDWETKRFEYSSLKRRDGIEPSKAVRPDGSRGLGPDDDLFLREYCTYEATKKVAWDKWAARSCRDKLSRLLPLACKSVRDGYRFSGEEREASFAERARTARRTALYAGEGADAVETLIVEGLYRFIQDDSIGEFGKQNALADLESIAKEIEGRADTACDEELV